MSAVENDPADFADRMRWIKSTFWKIAYSSTKNSLNKTTNTINPMKKTLLTVLTLALAIIASAQQPPVKPPKKANTIICTATDSVDVFTQVLKALAKNGYRIDGKDASVGSITTDRKVHKDFDHTIQFYIEGSTITATGEVFTKAYIMGSWTEASGKAYYAMRGSPASKTMDAISNLLSPIGTLTYERRK